MYTQHHYVSITKEHMQNEKKNIRLIQNSWQKPFIHKSKYGIQGSQQEIVLLLIRLFIQKT